MRAGKKEAAGNMWKVLRGTNGNNEVFGMFEHLKKKLTVDKRVGFEIK